LFKTNYCEAGPRWNAAAIESHSTNGSNDDDYAWLQTIQPLDAMESDDTQETGVEAHAFSFF